LGDKIYLELVNKVKNKDDLKDIISFDEESNILTFHLVNNNDMVGY
jgi:hypothetical protein